jgi:hypothetical protein
VNETRQSPQPKSATVQHAGDDHRRTSDNWCLPTFGGEVLDVSIWMDATSMAMGGQSVRDRDW